MNTRLQDQPTEVQAGDFIAVRGLGHCCGFVERKGKIKAGKDTVAGYFIRKYNGSRDFVPVADAVLIARQGDRITP